MHTLLNADETDSSDWKLIYIKVNMKSELYLLHVLWTFQFLLLLTKTLSE